MTVEPTTRVHKLHRVRNSLVRVSSLRMNWRDWPLTKTEFFWSWSKKSTRADWLVWLTDFDPDEIDVLVVLPFLSLGV